MSPPRLFPIAASLQQTCALLGASPARVLSRVGRAPEFLASGDKGVDARTYFAIWEALAAECSDPDLPLRLGQGAARGPFQPALLAFLCSPDIRTGFARLAVFKPLVAPIRLELTECCGGLDVAIHAEGNVAMPNAMAAAEVVFFLEFARTFSAHAVVPQSVQLPDLAYATPAYRDFVGAKVHQGPHTALSFTLADAQRPLVSVDTDFYRLVERELVSRLDALGDDSDIVAHVQRCLTALLPLGQVSVEAVASKLGLSKRSLQRKLQENGTSFQSVLDRTRASLALTYLREKNLSAEETSYLLAYQDPNSFYRAFHDWTGMTPAQARDIRPS